MKKEVILISFDRNLSEIYFITSFVMNKTQIKLNLLIDRFANLIPAQIDSKDSS